MKSKKDKSYYRFYYIDYDPESVCVHVQKIWLYEEFSSLHEAQERMKSYIRSKIRENQYNNDYYEGIGRIENKVPLSVPECSISYFKIKTIMETKDVDLSSDEKEKIMQGEIDFMNKEKETKATEMQEKERLEYKRLKNKFEEANK